MTTWRSEVATSLRQAAATLTAAKVPPEQSWSDYDKGAPKTPWGPAQGAYNIAPGVRWFHTAGHGGLMVAKGVAQKVLSDAARKSADFWAGNFWFEEDAQYAIAFLEHPEWGETLKKIAGGSGGTKESYLDVVTRYFPKYAEMQQSGFKMPEKLKIGDFLQFTKPITFGSKTFQKGDVIQVAKLTGSSILFAVRPGYDIIGFRLRMRNYHDGDVVKIDAPKAG